VLSVLGKVAVALVPDRLLMAPVLVSCHQFSVLSSRCFTSTKYGFCLQSIASLNKTLKAWLLLVNFPSQRPRCLRGGYVVAYLLKLRVRIAPGSLISSSDGCCMLSGMYL
jgi:hypothetical protein